MQNQAPLSPARALFEELRENEDAGLLDTWPAPHHTVDPAASPDNTREPVVSAFPGPKEISELTSAIATRRSPAGNYGDIGQVDKVERIHAVSRISDADSAQSQSALAAIIRLQSTEIERLALDNDRLVERMDAVNQLIEDEQNRRRGLDQQLHEARLRNAPPAPAPAPAPTFDIEDIRRAAREGMSAEIKPVLTAILDLLESALTRGAETVTPPAMTERTPVSPMPDTVFAEVFDGIQGLPEILTRPIDELTGGSGNAGLVPDFVVDAGEPASLQETRVCPPQPRDHKAQSSAIPNVFAWTNLFS